MDTKASYQGVLDLLFVCQHHEPQKTNIQNWHKSYTSITMNFIAGILNNGHVIHMAVRSMRILPHKAFSHHHLGIKISPLKCVLNSLGFILSLVY